LEAGFARAGHHSTLLCERDPAASRVLAQQFPEAHLHDDVTTLATLPGCDVVTAGFPCQDLSSVGRRRGIEGPNSGLIDYIFKLLGSQSQAPCWLVLENVPFMLQLDRGRAMVRIVDELELNGWSWAYRTIDTRSFGLPHRRRRVILLASKQLDPRGPLLCPDSSLVPAGPRAGHACGFYWTEGNTGLGWAIDAIPPLKSGSAVSIPSPPAI
jgi:DNA (cytosine-5)-methyltransferase 1